MTKSGLDKYHHYIDHTLLKPTSKIQDFERLCEQALEANFKAVCLPSCHVKMAKNILHKNKKIEICTVVGFPLGYETTEAKTRQTEIALNDGATEIDMVINQSWFHSGNFSEVQKEIQELNHMTSVARACLKVIVESCYMNAKDIEIVTKLVGDTGAQFIKTSTGFGSGGATVEAVQLMKKFAPPHLFIKASGGIKTLLDLEKMIEAGANRIGTSSAYEFLRDNS